MSLLSKAGSLLRQNANRQSIHQAIRCAPSMRTACTKSGETEGKALMDRDSGRSTGFGFTTSGAIRCLDMKDLHSQILSRREQNVIGLAVNDIIGQRRSFSSGATETTVGGNKPTRPKLDRTAASYLPNISVFTHITSGIEGIMADYVHQKMTKEFFTLCFSLFFLIIMKDIFLFLVFP